MPDVIITRPEPHASTWAQALAGEGLNAHALPLIELRPSRHAGQLQSAWRDIEQDTGYQALMFVSSSAVSHFFAAQHREHAGVPGGSWRAWATGPGTAQMLRNYGMPDERIDAPTESDPQWDSEALWHRVKFRLIRGARALPVLIVRGSDASGTDAGRPWLAQKLAEKGVVTNFTVAYERHLPTWSLEQGALALKARADGSVWVFSSSESIANLQHLLRDMAYFGAARALTTHPRIAEVARAAGFGEVLESHPAQQHVVQSLKSCL